MKSLKTFFTLLLFCSLIQTVLANNDLPEYCDSRIQVRVGTGSGTVYATNKDGSASPDNCVSTQANASLTNTKADYNRPCLFKISAKANPGYEFDYWECVQNEGKYDTDGFNGKHTGQVGDKLYLEDSEQGLGGYWTVYAALSPTGTNVINSIWEAHFKEITTKVVDVESENTSMGSATIDKGNNNVGVTVTITANCNNENTMFKGWYRLNPDNGEKKFVTMTNPYTFEIKNSNKGTYYARFDNGYYFWRVKNVKSNHYLMAKAYYSGRVTPLTFSNALNTQLGFDNDLGEALTDEGSMMRIYIKEQQEVTHKNIWDIYVQDDDTYHYYNTTPGDNCVFIVLNHYADNSYFFQDQGGLKYLYERSNNLGVVEGMPDDKSGNWQLEGMDKDLTTKENYFAVDPSEFIGPDEDGNYWTTLRVCFNMKYETSEITPYIVTAADASSGEMELTEVTGGIIPAKECVLLKCKSTDITRNVMIPTTSSATNPTGNLLISSTYYYKDQTVSNDAAFSGKTPKGIKLIDGRLGFGGDTKTTVDGNRAYLSIIGDVALPGKIPNVTLAELLDSCDTQRTYNITDLRAVEYVDQDRMLICKDNNGYANKDERSDNDFIDFMHTATLTNGIESTIPDDYDQSNWIGLRLPEGAIASTSLRAKNLKGVVGKLVNTTNPEFNLEQMPEADDNGAAFSPNVYIAASFIGSNNHQTSLVNGKEYYFVQPKPMEYANIEWAQWDGEKFIAPVHDEDHQNWNQLELNGEFQFNGSYLEQGGVDLENGHAYEMLPAIIKYNDSSNGQKGATNGYVVYPLQIEKVTSEENGIITAIDNLQAGKTVTSVVYYNMMGVASDKPHQGINIVETRYSDGSRTAVKIIK